MNILKGLKSLVGVVTNPENSILGMVKEYFPPSMSDTEKADLAQKISDADHNKTMQIMDKVNEATTEFNDRTKELEGTAADLKTIPYVGGIIIFLRGCQRPVWGFATLYFDYKWVEIGSTFSDKQELAILLINLLVLGFLFGERTLLNLQPIIKMIMETYVKPPKN